MVEYVWLDTCGPGDRPLPPSIKQLMKVMLDRLLFSYMMAKKLGIDQGIALLETLANLSNDDITSISDMHKRPDG